VDFLNPFLAGGAICFQLLSDFTQIPCQRVLDLFDGTVSFFVLLFDEVSNDSTFLVNKSADSGITGFALLNLLVDHA
jgi:hypothetical protein